MIILSIITLTNPYYAVNGDAVNFARHPFRSGTLFLASEVHLQNLEVNIPFAERHLPATTTMMLVSLLLNRWR